MESKKASGPQSSTDLDGVFLQEWSATPNYISSFLQAQQITQPKVIAHFVNLDQQERARLNETSRPTAEEYLQWLPALHSDDEAVFDIVFQEYLLGDETDPQWHERLSSRFPRFTRPLKTQIGVYRLLTTSHDFTADKSDRGQSQDDSERFELREIVGRGGVGIVYRAVDRRLGREVAIKMLHEAGAQAEFNRDRFEEEAAIIAFLQHPNIVQVFERTTIQGQSALVLEFIDGGSLAELMESGPLLPTLAARLCRDVALGMDYAHQRSIVHRDLKPSNILLAKNPDLVDSKDHYVPKVTDFGLAKRFGLSAETLSRRNFTVSGQLLGTPRYLAPEQAMGQTEQLGAPADIHALGIILYEMLVGHVPFEGPTVFDLVQQIAKEDAKFTKSDARRVPKDLQVICLKCLEKDPNRRYESARALTRDLDRYLNRQPILARPISLWGTMGRWCTRYPLVASLMVAVAILLMILAAGSTLAAIRLKRQSELAQLSEKRAIGLEQERRLELFRSLMENAYVQSNSGKEGQRFEAVRLLQEAKKIKPIESLSSEERCELVTTALTSLAHGDIRRIMSIPLRRKGDWWVDVDPSLQHIIQIGPANGVPIVRAIDGSEEAWQLENPSDNYIGQRLVQYSPTGRWIAETGYTGKLHPLRIWDTRTRKVRWSVTDGPIGLVVGFHPDDTFLAYCADSKIHLVDLDSGKETGRSPARFAGAKQMQFSPDGATLAIASKESGIQFVNFQTWEFTSAECPVPVNAVVAWHPDGKGIMAATLDGRLYAWNENEKRGWFWPVTDSNTEKLEFSRNACYLAVSNERETDMFRPDGHQHLIHMDGKLVRFADSGSRWAMIKEDRLDIDEFVDPSCYQQLLRSAESATLSPDGAIIAISGDEGVQLYATDPLTLWKDLELDACGPVTFDASGSTLITFGVFSGPQLWPIHRGEKWSIGPPRKISIPPPMGTPTIGLQPQHGGRHATFSKDGRNMSIVDMRNDRVLSLDRTDSSIKTIGSLARVSRAVLSFDGHFVAATSGNPRRVVVWDTQDSIVALDRADHGSADFSSDGKLLATRSTSAVHVHDCDTWKQIREIPLGHLLDFEDMPMAFQPDTHRIAAIRPDGDVCLLDADSGLVLARLHVHERRGRISSLSFSADGRRLAMNRLYSDVNVWDLLPLEQELQRIGLPEDLTPAKESSPVGLLPSLTVDRGPLVLGKDWHKYWRILASYEAIQRRWTDALNSIDRAIESCPLSETQSRVDLITLRGDFLVRCGRAREARDAWRAAIDLSPESLAACRSLAILYVAGPSELRQPDRVAALTTILHGDDRYQSDIMILLGMAQVRMGRFREALTDFDSATANADLQIAVPYFRAIALHQLGQHAEAQTVIEASRKTTHSSGSLPIDWASLNDEVQRVQGNSKSLPPGLP
ncbi:protein kinase [bacterium]|nr:protein kinase [bacterium]